MLTGIIFTRQQSTIEAAICGELRSVYPGVCGFQFGSDPPVRQMLSKWLKPRGKGFREDAAQRRPIWLAIQQPDNIQIECTEVTDGKWREARGDWAIIRLEFQAVLFMIAET